MDSLLRTANVDLADEARQLAAFLGHDPESPAFLAIVQALIRAHRRGIGDGISLASAEYGRTG